IAVAVLSGRGPIVVVEPSPTRREMATHLGAHAVHEPGTPLADLLSDIGWRRPTISPLLDADPVVATIFECVGSPVPVQTILAQAPAHSRVVLAGACTAPVEISPLQLTTTEVTVETTYAYRQADLVAAAAHLQARPDVFERFITREVGLDGAAAAFDALATDPREVKVLIHPSHA
ncbi:MAG TPA: zinc-binding dehydrogenase, partial [Ilumatobacteraceae bacterium]|nr:zinc-binding dehydrogenase [Ilumatobacteraceae bacterium]